MVKCYKKLLENSKTQMIFNIPVFRNNHSDGALRPVYADYYLRRNFFPWNCYGSSRPPICQKIKICQIPTHTARIFHRNSINTNCHICPQN